MTRLCDALGPHAGSGRCVLPVDHEGPHKLERRPRGQQATGTRVPQHVHPDDAHSEFDRGDESWSGRE